ncbi:hypothetical protein VTN77DRAFT_7726 [Rasamsonia byssochlamydoides]|uniref:uncharacterized protein n=1 Tax=Rasamsonia byssochlamydoides TaxID=89139 RepID=UPI0037441378
MATAPTPADNKRAERLFALTICAYRKPDMDEDAYHRYTSETHAPKLKELLQHNTTPTKSLLTQIFGSMPETQQVADYDCFIQIVFRDVADYIAVKEDPHYKEVIFPDHANFADMARTKMVTGWLEVHVENGRVV